LILDTINFKCTVKFRVNCGWDENSYPSNGFILLTMKLFVMNMIFI
jgi:hypothetical protein